MNAPVPIATDCTPVARQQVERLEREIQKLPQVDCPVRHYFAPGMAAREMTIPAGVVVTGAVHRHEHLCTVSKGRIVVSTDDGMKELAAPCTIVSSPGAKRVGYAIEETVWTTYHATNETDPDRLIEEITESTSAELIGGERNLQLLAQLDRDDYARFLREYGLSQDTVTLLVENTADQTEFPPGITALELRESPIAGMGMFTTNAFRPFQMIAPVRLGAMRTPAGRYINHSARPNVAFEPTTDGGLTMYALREISAGEELTVCYRQAMSVNGSGLQPIEVQV